MKIINEIDDCVPNSTMATDHFTIRALNFIIIFFSFSKVMTLMRVNEDFALLVKLIHQCFIDVKIFLFFTVAWIIFFTLEALILGIQISE